MSYATVVAALTNVKALWLLDETSGAPADSIDSHTGTISGTVTQGVTSIISSVAHSASFGGGRVAVVASTDFVFGTGDYTVGFWINSSSAATQFVIAHTGLSWYIDIVTGHVGMSSSNAPINSVANVCDGNTHFVVVTRSGPNVVMYVDGVSNVTGTDGLNISVNDALSVGDYQAGGSPVIGVLGGVFVCKGTGISAGDVAALYAAGTSPPPPAAPPTQPSTTKLQAVNRSSTY